MNKYKVNASELNIRSNPSLDGLIIGKVKFNSIVESTNNIGGWHNIGKGWVNGKFLEAIIEVETKNKIINCHHWLDDNQFYHEVTKKEQVCWHHSAGGSAKSSVDWWNSVPARIATPYFVERNGDIIEVFDDKYWAYALGIKGGILIEKKTIQIEMASFGWLTEKNGKYFGMGNKEIPKENVQLYPKGYRGAKAYEKYTPQQIDNTVYLTKHLAKKHKLKLKAEKDFWLFGAKATGLYSHTTFRKDKSDFHPQPELIEATYRAFK